PGDPPDPSDLPDGCTFRPRCPRPVAACAEREPALVTVGPEGLAAHRAACVHAVPGEGGPR
ncbi:oligopeptide/dipeptide ABC transporter ATP-binding protein, partial [Streptomyces sp. NPDC058953]